MKFIITSILKEAFTPILAQSFFESAKETWQYNKIAAIILYFGGFLFTPLGLFIIFLITLYLILKKYKII